MSKKVIYLQKDTLELLIKIDNWLRKETIKSNSKKTDKKLLQKTRLLIDNIITKGYYQKTEQELLNELRSQFIKNNK